MDLSGVYRAEYGRCVAILTRLGHNDEVGPLHDWYFGGVVARLMTCVPRFSYASLVLDAVVSRPLSRLYRTRT